MLFWNRRISTRTECLALAGIIFLSVWSWICSISILIVFRSSHFCHIALTKALMSTSRHELNEIGPGVLFGKKEMNSLLCSKTACFEEVLGVTAIFPKAHTPLCTLRKMLRAIGELKGQLWILCSVVFLLDFLNYFWVDSWPVK